MAQILPDAPLATSSPEAGKVYRLLKRLPDEVFTHSVTHPEYDAPYTFDRWLSIYSGHIPDHIAQMQKTVQAWQAGRTN